MQSSNQKGGLSSNAKNQSRALVSSMAPPEKSNLFALGEENIYDPIVLLPLI
jgi:hypothetical protein